MTKSNFKFFFSIFINNSNFKSFIVMLADDMSMLINFRILHLMFINFFRRLQLIMTWSNWKKDSYNFKIEKKSSRFLFFLLLLHFCVQWTRHASIYVLETSRKTFSNRSINRSKIDCNSVLTMTLFILSSTSV